MPQRYKIIGQPDRSADGQLKTKYVILDNVLYGNCTLPPVGMPLEWPTRSRAELWLDRCYSTWREWEKDGREVPDNWEPYGRVPKISPFTERRYPQEYFR